MKKLALGALFAGLAACGGGGDNPQINVGDDDGGVIAACNPKAQSGCDADEKCTWIVDQQDPPLGHVGCAAVGSGIAVDGACMRTAPGAGGGIDECAKGLVCLSGVCKQICDNAGGEPTCDANHSCEVYSDFLEDSGSVVAGVCDPACDPLTQDLKLGANAAACGSDPVMPTSGCYGFDQYSCAPALALTATDRQPPRTNASGNAYLNGCAPGFMPFWRESTGSTAVVCAGFCAALETDSTPANMNNGVGSTTAIGKLPTTAKQAGDATCAPGKKGAGNDSRCLFIWPYVTDDETGELPAAFAQGPYRDTLGVCFSLSFYMYDADGDMTPDTAYPDCKTLPRNAAQYNGPERVHAFDDASDFSCQLFENTPQEFNSNGKREKPLAMRDFRPAKGGTMELARHSLD